MADEARILNVLFLCPDNAARSIIAEAIMNRDGLGRYRAFSAGSYPAAKINPHTVRLLKGLHFPVNELRPKAWAEFAGPKSPELDFVFVLDAEAAEEIWPEWPGDPVTARWLMPDPATSTGAAADISRGFADAYRTLNLRIELFLRLPLALLDRLTLRERLDSIGRSNFDPVVTAR
jgi:protein-tyrosine-phosphatase